MNKLRNDTASLIAMLDMSVNYKEFGINMSFNINEVETERK